MSLMEHLAGGATSLCRCWAVRRRDGVTLGFTDHDRDLAFEGTTFRADSGMTARAFQQGTGLSVDNSEAVGALSHAAITEADIEAGRYDDAEVTAWMVNWAAPEQRMMQFRGSLGEITRAGGAFRAELRGLTEALNKPQGLVYQRQCSAVLGDRRCRVDLSDPAYRIELPVEQISRGKVLTFTSFGDFASRWFERGRVTVLDGAAAGLTGAIKSDRIAGEGRVLELWQQVQAPLATGDTVRIEAGCDKRPETCKGKFANYANYRGFPDIPGEDWLMAYPTGRVPNDGGSLS